MLYHFFSKPCEIVFLFITWIARWRCCFLFLWMLGSLPILVHAQLPESKTALLRIFKDSKQADTLRLKAWNALQGIYISTNLDSFLYMSQQMEQYGMRQRNTLWQGEAWKDYGTFYMLSGQLDSAKYAYSKAKNLYVKRDNVFYASILYNLGNLYFYQNNVDSAIYYFQKAIPGMERYDQFEIVGALYHNLGVIYQDRRDYTKALYYFEIAKKNAGLATKVDILINISTIFKNLGMFDEAEKNAREGLRLAQKGNNPSYLANAYCTMIACAKADVSTIQQWVNKALSLKKATGLIDDYCRILSTAGSRFLFETNQSDLAEQYIKRAIAEAEKIQQEDYLTRSKIDLAYLYVQQKKYRQAVQVCSEVNSSIKSDPSSVVHADYLQVASDAFAGLGMIDSAYHYLNKLNLFEKKEEDNGINRSIMLSYLDYQQKQEKEALQLQKAAAEALTKEVQKRQRATVGIFALLTLFLVSIAGSFYVFFRQRSRTAAQLSAQNAALQRSNERLRRFSGVVSHDILSNLDLMLSAGHVLVGKHAKKESLTQYYDIAQRTSRQLKDYCLGLLEEARSAVGTVGRMSDPMPVVEAVLARQEIALLSKGCSINLEPLSPTLLPPSIVEQVFQNLVSNAIRYGLDAPAPLLRIAEEQDRLRGTTRWVVEDNGKGVPSALHEAIFEKTPTEGLQSQGLGLGLKLLRETLKSYGAKIWVEDRVGGGARFVVDLGMQGELQGERE